MVAVGFAAIELLVLAGLGAVYFGKRWFSDARVRPASRRDEAIARRLSPHASGA